MARAESELLSLLTSLAGSAPEASSGEARPANQVALAAATMAGGKHNDTPVASALGRLVTETVSNDSVQALNRQLAALVQVAGQQTRSTESNTEALIENSLAQSAGNKISAAASVGKTVLSFLGGGLGLVSLVGKLLGGGEGTPAPATARFELPPAIQLDAGILPGSSTLSSVRYAQDGLPRPAATWPAAGAPNITVQVQAIDSRSFLDHSSEIAQAVREALLHSHSLNDVMGEM